MKQTINIIILINCSDAAAVPVVVVAVEGGISTLRTICRAIEKETPAIIVEVF